MVLQDRNEALHDVMFVTTLLTQTLRDECAPQISRCLRVWYMSAEKGVIVEQISKLVSCEATVVPALNPSW